MSERKSIYLDYNATSPLLPLVKQAMIEAMDVEGNPSSVHSSGRKASNLVEESRAKVAALIGARPRDVIFTSGGTEAANLAIKGSPTKSVIISAMEHSCVRSAAESSGKPVYLVGIDRSGNICLDDLKEKLEEAEKPALISIMTANNEAGCMTDMGQIVDLSKDYDVRIHTDAVQAVGKADINFTALDIDYLSLSAHKFGGPKGIGALITKPAAPIAAQIVGGGQELGRRSGTESVLLIAGMGAAALCALEGLGDLGPIASLRDYMEDAIAKQAPDVIIVGRQFSNRLPNTSSFIMPATKGETQVMHMDLHGICISSGSACSSGKVNVSGVMQALGFDVEDARCSIRVSLGKETTKDEIDAFIAAYLELYKRTMKNRQKTA